MPKGIRKPKDESTTVITTKVTKSKPNLVEQIAENEHQILETEKLLANLKEMRIMLMELKDKNDMNELFTMLKSSGLSVSEFMKTKNQTQEHTQYKAVDQAEE